MEEFDFSELNQEAQEELSNGRSEQHDDEQSDNEVSTDSPA